MKFITFFEVKSANEVIDRFELSIEKFVIDKVSGVKEKEVTTKIITTEKVHKNEDITEEEDNDIFEDPITKWEIIIIKWNIIYSKDIPIPNFEIKVEEWAIVEKNFNKEENQKPIILKNDVLKLKEYSNWKYYIGNEKDDIRLDTLRIKLREFEIVLENWNLSIVKNNKIEKITSGILASLVFVIWYYAYSLKVSKEEVLSNFLRSNQVKVVKKEGKNIEKLWSVLLGTIDKKNYPYTIILNWLQQENIKEPANVVAHKIIKLFEKKWVNFKFIPVNTEIYYYKWKLYFVYPNKSIVYVKIDGFFTK